MATTKTPKYPKISKALQGNKNSVGNKGGGRISSFKPEYLKKVRNLCLLGALDKDFADFFGVSETTICRWKKEYPEFAAALREGKEEADAQVVRSLFERATGYSHKATKFFNANGRIISADYTEKYPPDVTAAMFWLKNRQPMKWRDKPLEDGGNEPIPTSVPVTIVDASVPEDPVAE